MRPAIRVEVVDSLLQVDEGRWRDLIGHCPDSTIFQSPEWLSAWQRTFCSAGAEVRVFLATEGGRLVGIAPLYSDSKAGVEGWHLVGEDYSDYQVFSVHDGSQRVVEALLRAMDLHLPRGEKIHIPDVPNGSALHLRLSHQANLRASGLFLTSLVQCPGLKIKGNNAGVRQVLEKASLRRSRRSLEKMGELQIEHMDKADEIRPLLQGFFAQHIERWSDTPSPSLFLQEHNRSFYTDIVASLGSVGATLFTTIRVAGEPIAQHFGLRSGGKLLWYKPTFSPAFAEHSPGDSLISALIEKAMDGSIQELDFTRGQERFKYRFSSGAGVNSGYVWARSAEGRFRFRSMGFLRRTRARVQRPNEPELHTLGGRVRVESADIILVLDADERSSQFLANHYSRGGLVIHRGCEEGSKVAVEGQFASAQPKERCAFVEWLQDACERERYALVAFGRSETFFAASDAVEDPVLRARMLLPEKSSVVQMLSIDGEEIDGVIVRVGDLPDIHDGLPIYSVRLLFSLGRLLHDSIMESVLPQARARGDEASLYLDAIRRLILRLSDLNWSGAVSLVFYKKKDTGLMAIVRPYLYSAGSFSRETESMPWEMWRLANCTIQAMR